MILVCCIVISLSLAVSQKMTIRTPQQLSAEMGPNPISFQLSPMGFKPLSSVLYGEMEKAIPASACSKIQDLHTLQKDIFIFVDDTDCLESIKAQKVAESGALVGILKKNLNNTLHDREINLVHIPIIQLNPSYYDQIMKYHQNNPQTAVGIIIDFTHSELARSINLQIWLSPTEAQSYSLLLQLSEFLREQFERVSFMPRYVIHSERQRKPYVGCLSYGRYCAPQLQYQRKAEGKNVVLESLRQITIWKVYGADKWWSYIKFYSKECLTTLKIFIYSENLASCTENALLMSGINPAQLEEFMQASFTGTRMQIDNNLYLEEERQSYLNQKITKFPVALVNKKELKTLNAEALRNTICKMESPSQRQGTTCSPTKDQWIFYQVLTVLGVLLVVMLVVLMGYKALINWRMNKEVKRQVDETLQSYYRYISTLQSEDGSCSHDIGRGSLQTGLVANESQCPEQQMEDFRSTKDKEKLVSVPP